MEGRKDDEEEWTEGGRKEDEEGYEEEMAVSLSLLVAATAAEATALYRASSILSACFSENMNPT